MYSQFAEADEANGKEEQSSRTKTKAARKEKGARGGSQVVLVCRAVLRFINTYTLSS
jgi:hypothetical protein